jgi:tetratricopeptide (TPR) repeat protein
LKIDSKLALGYYNLGMSLKAMGRLRDAIASYQHATKLHPEYAEAYQNLGVALLKIGNVIESVEAFRHAIALHQQHNPEEANRLRQGLLEMGFKVG